MEEQKKEIDSVLFKKTVELYKNRPNSLKIETIVEETGLKESWLNNFADNGSEPSVVKIEKLYNYLSNKKLKV